MRRSQNSSDVEETILASEIPLNFPDGEVITVNNERGKWLNKSEISNWKGFVPIESYSINQDSSPEITNKKSKKDIIYDENVTIRYLQPPTPPPIGELYLRQEPDIPQPAAPPLIIRQEASRAKTPEPLIIREEPPKMPPRIGAKIVKVAGKNLPPPPRRVVIEKIPPAPTKPRPIIIERWLPFKEQKRKVIYQKAQEVVREEKPRNRIIQWEFPQPKINRVIKEENVVKFDPVEYVRLYGSTLVKTENLPDYARNLKPKTNLVFAADKETKAFPELEGDIDKLKLIDLDREGLSEYKYLFTKKTEHVISTVRSEPDRNFYERKYNYYASHAEPLSYGNSFQNSYNETYEAYDNIKVQIY